MAQIIKHRRGSISQLKDVTAKVGELVMATGSINDLNGPFIFIGETENAAGGYRAVSKLYSGNAAPTISNVSYGTVLDGTPFYAAGNETLYILSSGGNTALDLTGNIEGNTISGVTINNLSSTNVSASFFTGSFKGDGTNLFNIPASGVTGLNLSMIASGAFTASISEVGGFNVNTDTEITGTLVVTDDVTFEKDLYVSGNIYQTGSYYTQGNIVLSGSINIGDNLTGDTINFGGEVNSNILPTTGATYDLGSSGKTWNNVWAENAHFTNISIGDITLEDLSLPGDLTVSGTTTLSGSVYVEDLIQGRVVLAGANGQLVDNENFLYDLANGFLMNTSGSVNINTSGSLNLYTHDGNDIYMSSSSDITLEADTDVNITAGDDLRMYANDTFSLRNNSADESITLITNYNGSSKTLSFDVSGSLTIPGGFTGSFADITTQAQLASAAVEDLTDNRIVLAGVGGELEDDANFTFDGTTLKVGNGYFEVDNADGDIRTSGSITTNGLTNNGDLTVNGVLTVTGNTQLQSNLYVSGNLEVLGSATEVHIQATTVEIGDNIILVNAYSPFQRYAGITGYDSGSVGASGSLLWDSLNDYWLLQNSNESTSKVIGTTSGSMGSEVSLIDTYFPIATGPNTIGDSLLRYSGTTLSFNTNKFTLDSSSGNVYVDGNVTINGAGGTNYSGYTSQIVFKNTDDVLGFLDTSDTINVTDRLLGYNSSTGVLEFSSLIDGGTY
jgi:cytoskeletal protein CcmA (bactofilin family)